MEEEEGKNWGGVGLLQLVICDQHAAWLGHINRQLLINLCILLLCCVQNIYLVYIYIYICIYISIMQRDVFIYIDIYVFIYI